MLHAGARAVAGSPLVAQHHQAQRLHQRLVLLSQPPLRYDLRMPHDMIL